MVQGLSKSFLLIPLFTVCFLSLACLGVGPNRSDQPITDPDEARALNSFFNQWDIEAKSGQWNLSGEPCSGAAIDSTNFENSAYNPFIKCDCSYTNGLLCHITHLKVYALNVVGPIPEELWTLTYLKNLNLAGNFLTGPLSPSIGSLARIQYLRVGTNALSGQLPKEMGQLTNLLSLSLGPNNFSGPLPAELGNLLLLERLYIDSSGVRGEIPPTYAQMQNLNTLWASDIKLTGKIPEFIGNWQKLKILRLQGNNFEGPIPSTFSGLSSLTDLRISELSDGGSSLAFIKDMKSLKVLILRNNKISDTIPISIGQYENLTQLDLSFNNINGKIPDSLFNMSSLSVLFLGNNSLNGALPRNKSRFLFHIDLSYNYLADSLPSWVNQPKLQLNLVGNNFKLDNTTSRRLPSGLNCLQRNFPCKHGRGIYNRFGINCGGPQITSTDGVVLYEKDDRALGPATYFVTSSKRWAVSNVGILSGNIYQRKASKSGILLQTARQSTSSLRYFFLGIENGNYIVNLQFVEVTLKNPPAQLISVGRRVFDIYAQGNLVLKDFVLKDLVLKEFSVQKEAEYWISSHQIQKKFKVQVTENYLEIHLFWAGKGTCCIPVEGTYGPSITTISITPDRTSGASNKSPDSDEDETDLSVVWIFVGVGAAILLVIFLLGWAIYFIVQKNKKSQTNEHLIKNVGPTIFLYDELRDATNDFSPANKLGEGAYGPVYKGTLADGRAIAVKKLSKKSRQGIKEFEAEISTLSMVRHSNLVTLYGWYFEENNQLLVYEYMEKKSLDHALFDEVGRNDLELNWSARFNICSRVAKALAYLHEDIEPPIIHRDIKPGNILLDSNLNPKISDFGLAKLHDDEERNVHSGFAGTYGYAAPEYARFGRLSEKTDVFAFGIVALETVAGRRYFVANLEEEKQYLPRWARDLHDQNRELLELVDPNLSEFDQEQVRRVIGAALLCTQGSSSGRPPMSRVVNMLNGDIEVNTTGMSRLSYVDDLDADTETSPSTDFSTRRTDHSTLNEGSTSMLDDGGLATHWTEVMHESNIS